MISSMRIYARKNGRYILSYLGFLFVLSMMSNALRSNRDNNNLIELASITDSDSDDSSTHLRSDNAMENEQNVNDDDHVEVLTTTSTTTGSGTTGSDDDDSALLRYVREHSGTLDGRLKYQTIILTYASYSYVQPMMNWMVHMNRLGMMDIVGVVCIDEAMYKFFEERGYDCFPLYKEGSSSTTANDGSRLSLGEVRQLWVTRMSHLVVVLKDSIDVVFSDSDAIWLKDPFAAGVFGSKRGDIVSGKGQFPWNVAEAWGSALCMGVIYFHSTEATIALAESALQETKKTNDDQVGLNTVLFTIGGKSPYSLFGRKLKASGPSDGVAIFKFRTSKGKKPKQVRVAMISHDKIPRFCNLVTPESVWEKEVLIAHCHPADGEIAKTNMQKGNEKTHTDMLKKYKLFHLKEGWESVNDAFPSIDEFIKAIDSEPTASTSSPDKE